MKISNCFVFLCAFAFCACAIGAEDHYWCEGTTVAIEKCPTNEAIRNITVELAKGFDGKIVPTSMLFGVKVKTGSYELDLNVDKWLAWSRGEAGKDGLIWFTVPKGVWETFGKDGKLTLTIKDNKGSLTDPVKAVAVMSDCADWPGEKDCPLTDNADFKKWLSDMVFNLTYNKEGKPFVGREN